jgi:hypothetical protein
LSSNCKCGMVSSSKVMVQVILAEKQRTAMDSCGWKPFPL